MFCPVAEAKNMVFQSVGVVRYLFWLGKPAIVRDEEIDTIQKWLIQLRPMMLAYTLSSRDAIQFQAFFKSKAIVQEVTNTHYLLVLESLGCVLMKIK
jgi:hypothetical protein